MQLTSLRDIIEHITYAALEHTQLDWYNNDGGQGDLTIDLSNTPPTIVLSLGINHVETEDYTFGDDEEED